MNLEDSVDKLLKIWHDAAVQFGQDLEEFVNGLPAERANFWGINLWLWLEHQRDLGLKVDYASYLRLRGALDRTRQGLIAQGLPLQRTYTPSAQQIARERDSIRARNERPTSAAVAEPAPPEEPVSQPDDAAQPDREIPESELRYWIEAASTSRLFAAWAAVYPCSRTSFTAEILNSRVNRRLPMGFSFGQHFAVLGGAHQPWGRSEWILPAEQTLGLKFPPTYRAFLRRFGCAATDGDEFYGIIGPDFANSGVPDAIWSTLEERGTSQFPSSLITIGTTGDGGVYALDTSQADESGENPVVEWWPLGPDAEGNGRTIASDIGTFLLDQIGLAD